MTGIKLTAGPYEAVFRPDLAMLCTSMRHLGEEFVARPRPLTDYRAGRATAIPFIHPWGNRLSQWHYTAAGRDVSLEGVHLPVDGKGLPLHGNLFAAPFDVVFASDTLLRAQLDYGAHADKLRAFPFPHVVTIDATLHPREGLTIITRIEPTSDVAVPVSFCWHPYVRLPAGARSAWILDWPECEHVEVDERVIPTGARTPQAAEHDRIGDRTFDDHYALGRDRTFAIRAAGRTLTLTFPPPYDYAQLFVPPTGRFVAIEPMTAEINALVAGTAPVCAPGDRFRADFHLRVTR